MADRELYSNNARSTLVAGISDVDTALSVQPGEGSRFPSPTASEFFYLTLVDTSGNLEIVKVTSRTADAMVIVRAQQNTGARNFSAGDLASHRHTADAMARVVQKNANEVITGTLQVPAPSVGADAVNKTYCDDKLLKAGGTMTGTLVLNGDPSASNDAANKNYVDTADTNLQNQIDAITAGATPFQLVYDNQESFYSTGLGDPSSPPANVRSATVQFKMRVQYPGPVDGHDFLTNSDFFVACRKVGAYQQVPNNGSSSNRESSMVTLLTVTFDNHDLDQTFLLVTLKVVQATDVTLGIGKVPSTFDLKIYHLSGWTGGGLVLSKLSRTFAFDWDPDEETGT